MVMSPETNEMTKPKPLELLEGAAIIGSVGGAVLAAVTQQALFAALPLSLSAALSFSNRRSLQTELSAQHQSTAEMLSAQVNEHSNNIKNLMQELIHASAERQQSFLDQTNQSLADMGSRLAQMDEKFRSLEEKSEHLEEQQSELLASTFEENYCRRGQELEKRGEFQEAIAAYAEVLRLNADYAEAYLLRGKAYAYAGKKQLAIADLRAATKLFFDGGDLDNYHLARDISEQVHAGTLVAPVVTELESAAAAVSASVSAPKPAPLPSPVPSPQSAGDIPVDELFV